MASKSDRVFCIVWYLVVFVCVGLPIWWFSTLTYRAEVSLADLRLAVEHHVSDAVRNDAGSRPMLRSDGTLLFRIRVQIRSDAELESELLRDSNRFFAGKFIPISPNGRAEIVIVPGASVKSQSSAVGDLVFIRNAAVANNKLFVPANDRIVFYSKEFGKQELFNFVEDLCSSADHHRYETDFDYHVTLVNKQLLKERFGFDAAKLKTQFLDPFVRELSRKLLVNASVSIQNLNLNLPTSRRANRRAEVFSKDLVSANLMTHLDHYMFSSMFTKPVVNVVVYFVPPHQEQALLHYDDGSIDKYGVLSLLVPFWGSLTIVKPPHGGPEAVAGSFNKSKVQISEQIVAHEIIQSVKELLNFPKKAHTNSDRVLNSSVIPDWQSDIVFMRKLAYQYNVTRNNLISIASNIDNLSTLIISDKIADRIRASIETFQRAKIELSGGHESLERAAKTLNHAHYLSETVLSDPTFVCDSYFPDNQRYAIYLPICVPVSVPIAASPYALYKLLKRVQ